MFISVPSPLTRFSKLSNHFFLSVHEPKNVGFLLSTCARQLQIWYFNDSFIFENNQKGCLGLEVQQLRISEFWPFAPFIDCNANLPTRKKSIKQLNQHSSVPNISAGAIKLLPSLSFRHDAYLVQ